MSNEERRRSRVPSYITRYATPSLQSKNKLGEFAEFFNVLKLGLPGKQTKLKITGQLIEGLAGI